MTKFSFFVPAVALGLAAATPAVAQDNGFEGARAEALIGFDHVSIKDFGMSGLGLGGLVGYDWQDGNIVYGFEGEVDGNTTRKTSVDQDERRAIKANLALSAGARVGYVLSPKALVYGKAGYTVARFRSDWRDEESKGYARLVTTGFRVGAGVEYKLSDAAFVKGEVRLSHYGKDGDLEQGLWREQALAGVGIRF